LLGKADLFERYIDRQLSPEVRESDRLRKDFKNRQWAYKTLVKEPDWRDVMRSLGWLAGQLQDKNQVELLIEKMQPSWLDEGRSRGRYRLIYELLLGLFLGLMFNLYIGLLSRLIIGLMFNLFVGLICGRVFGLIFGLGKIEPISMSCKVRRKTLRSLRRWLMFWLSVGLIAGLLSGVFVGLSVGLIYGLVFALIVGLICGLIIGLKQDLKMRSRPNQGIWNSLHSFVWITVFSYPLGVILAAGTTTLPIEVLKAVTAKQPLLFIAEVVQESVLHEIISGIACAFIFGLFGGGLACIQHLCLRLILTHDRKIPWNYARFLNYCVERRLLQRIGGRYRFIHRELLDHFALSKNYPL